MKEACFSGPLIGFSALKLGDKLNAVIKSFFFFSFFLFLTSDTAQSAVVFGGVVSFVTDGDTLWLQPDKGGATLKLRIFGIDAPEICQAGGDASRIALRQLVLHKKVSVTITRNDVYGRGLARIQLGSQDIGAQMVRSGQAWSYKWHNNPGPYSQEQSLAQRSHLGLFSDERALNPRDFRKRHGTCHLAKRSSS